MVCPISYGDHKKPAVSFRVGVLLRCGANLCRPLRQSQRKSAAVTDRAVGVQYRQLAHSVDNVPGVEFTGKNIPGALKKFVD